MYNPYSDPTLSKDTLGDDYQSLFVNMLLDHVDTIIAAWDRNEQPKPLHLMLLGTAGTGKTRAVQTLMQELHTKLSNAGLPIEFVRAAAPTGSAAFNMRFNASTIHRLIHWFNPRFWKKITNDDHLQKFQDFMRRTQLLIFDEVSMIGRQMMGRIDSRMQQGLSLIHI